ncbi:MAG: 2-amino-4-hydroxy-6-hydroxymethyldihydropteridine diphosphokinase [Verrucomicrobiia bacterium Tous-C5FEB]|jgi:2-amino-4-hydroxy-6-hydroxymethyldihydropteridine diphosphokinase|nr:MAG: 2-amino-4-hydroxy-6-hydroxymethyldihydropteridine diphosphokinase [Verrucomicrobiae bacterium Tous-C5FEB]
MPRVGIALGSNLGDRMANLNEAIRLIGEIALKNEPFLKAPIYQTEPLHCPPDSPNFLNTVVEFSFDDSAEKLLELTREIEKSMGRKANPQRNAPRVIDVDILYLGEERCNTPNLILPHPRLHGRRFVLQPLADIRPDLVLPGHSKCIASLLEELTSDKSPLIPFN